MAQLPSLLKSIYILFLSYLESKSAKKGGAVCMYFDKKSERLLTSLSGIVAGHTARKVGMYRQQRLVVQLSSSSSRLEVHGS